MTKIINIPNDFSKFTGLRYKALTPGVSGEEFRDNLLIPAIDEFGKVKVILDGNTGEYLPSFLEECFGGLIRKKKYTYEQFKNKIEIISNDDKELINDIDYYVRRETDK